jgi:hypothetical protein
MRGALVEGRAILSLLSAAAVALLAPGCAARSRAPAGAPGPAALSAGLTARDLDDLRAVVIRYYRNEKPEHWESFVVELRRGALFLENELSAGSPPAIGAWHFESHDGRAALVRQPPAPTRFPAVLIDVGVYLARQGERWRVTEDYQVWDEVDER